MSHTYPSSTRVPERLLQSHKASLHFTSGSRRPSLLFYGHQCRMAWISYDAQVLANSELFWKGESGELFPQMLRQVNGVFVPLLILGDPAYPLLQWILKLCSDNGRLSQPQCLFNYRLSHARVVTDNTFGILKGQWRCLVKRNDAHISRMSTVVAVCAILHNICEIHGDKFNHEWFEDLEEIAINHPVAETED